MKHSHSIQILVAGLLLALLVSAILPIAAFADDGLPPAEPTPTPEATGETAPSAEPSLEPTSEVTPEPALEESVPTEAASANEAAAALESTEVVISEDTAEILAAIPEGTKLILLDEQGEPVSLASEEASEMLEVVDPMWCPTGVTPGGAGCSADFPNLAALVAGFVPTGNGVIWIESGADGSAGAILIDGAAGWAAANLYSLELKGGWDGLSGSTTTNPLTPSTFTFRISITNWLAIVTLSDIYIDTSLAGNGLTVGTTKNIVLTRVTSSNNPQRGAVLNNTSGTGTVTVTDSTFNGNAGGGGIAGGLRVLSTSSVTLNGVTAGSNLTSFGFGAELNNTFGSGSISVSSSTFNSNGGFGLVVSSDSNITLTSVTAGSNSTGGANLDNDSGTGTVKVTSSAFNSNGGVGGEGGLEVLSKGAITLTSVTANLNDGSSPGYGTFLANTTGSGGITITSSFFDNNVSSGGIFAGSAGSITLTSVDASFNALSGADLTNTTGTAGVTISGVNSFNSNGNLGGLNIDTNGSISITGVTATLNASYGADLDADGGTGTVTVKSSTFSNNTVAAGFSGGLKISSKGSITLTSVTASSNLTGLGNGAYLENTAGTGNVTVSSSTFSSNAAEGILVYSNGNITFTGVTANSNAAGGGYVNNSTGTGSVTINTSTINTNSGNDGLNVQSHGTITLNGVTVSGNTGNTGATLDNSAAGTAKNILITGVNEFNQNWRWGLAISSKGSVTIKDVTANENGQSGVDGAGVYIVNTLGTGGVTFTGTNIMNENYDQGLRIETNGTVKLNNIIANSNGYYGVHIYSTAAASVTFTGSSQAKFNDIDNIHIETLGAVTLTNITANSSLNGYGISVDNDAGTAGVTITGTNTISNNDATGLSILSAGTISLSNITANDNGGHGAQLDNSADVTSAYSKVSISGTNSFSGNVTDGLKIFTNGSIILNSVTANDNVTGYGAYLYNVYGGFTNSAQPVTLTGANAFSDNSETGLYIESYGAITISNVTANSNGNSNGDDGVHIYNLAAATSMAVTISGTNKISENYDNGLVVLTNGAFKGNSITANDNGIDAANSGFGAWLGSTFAEIQGNVTLAGTNTFTGNYQGGLQIHTHGAVSLSNVTASSTIASGLTYTGHGLYIDNRYDNSLTPQNVTISGTNIFNINHCIGLYVFTYGTITLNSATATVNGSAGCGISYGSGIYLDNDNGTIPKGITLSGTNDVESNYTDGINIISLGAIKVNSLTAVSNGTSGAAGFGAYMANDDVGAVGGITLTGVNNFSNNFSTGLQIQSFGAISVNSVIADGNGSGGSGNGATLLNYYPGTAQTVTLTGTNSFGDNDAYGLWIQTMGAVSISNVTANDNDSGSGAYIDNTVGAPTTSAQAVTVSGTNTFSGNSYRGIDAISLGAITLNSTTAEDNGDDGAHLENYGSDLPQKVALTGTNVFTSNGVYGLYIRTKGPISSATKLTAKENGGAQGAYLDNDETGAVGGVTLSGTNTFSNNAYDGIRVNSDGAITINNLLAENNGTSTVSGSGAWLDNDDAGTPADVKLTGYIKLNFNEDYGLKVDSAGNISLNNLSADDNEAPALELDNITEGKGVTLSGTNLVTGTDAGYGVNISSHGPVTINGLTASGNDSGGLIVDNQVASSAQTVKLTGTNRFENNVSGNGFVIFSEGSVTLNNIYAYGNSSSGGYVKNDYGLGNVTLTGTNTFSENGVFGLHIDTNGSVTISNIAADGNIADDGLHVEPNAINVTIACGRFTNNGGDGIDITYSGLLTLKGVISSGNTGTDLLYSDTVDDGLYSGYPDLVTVRSC